METRSNINQILHFPNRKIRQTKRGIGYTKHNKVEEPQFHFKLQNVRYT